MVSKKEEISPEERARRRAKSTSNLIPRNGFTKEELQKGQRAAAKKRKERRAARELMQDILNMATGTDTLEAGTLEEVAQEIAQAEGSLSVYQAALIAQAARAVAGDTAAAAFCRDTAGDKPTDRQEISGQITAGDKALCEAVAARLEVNKSPDLGADKLAETDK